jgi:hypothetical protein
MPLIPLQNPDLAPRSRWSGSGGAAREREEADVAALVGKGRQILHVTIAIDVAGQVGPAQIEEHPLDEQIDELIEQPALQCFVAFDELDGAQDIVLFGVHPLDQSVLCIHGLRFRQRGSGSLPAVRFCGVKPCEMGRTTQ